MKGTIVFDFDYTLLDTAAFKRALAEAVSACGISASCFWDRYEAAHKGGRNRNFDLEAYLDELAIVFCSDRACMQAKADSIINDTAAFLHEGAVTVLRQLQELGYALILLTHGNTFWQQRRVQASGLHCFFDQIMYTEEEKEKTILHGLGEPLCIVNDNGEEIDAMQILLPGARFVAVRGPKSLPRDPSIPVCSTLGEVYEKITSA